MSYYIGELNLNPSTQPLEVSRECFDSLQFAWKVICSTRLLEIKFHIIIEAYRVFESDLFNFVLDDSLSASFERSTETRFLVKTNHLVLSLLTAVRAYHDQRPQDLKAISDDKKRYVEQSNAVFSRIYDDCIDYKIMEGLRNYAQHKQLPIQRFSIGSERTDTRVGISMNCRTVDPKFDLQDVMKDKKPLREALTAHKLDWVDVKHSVRSYVGCIVRGHNEVRQMLAQEVNRACALIKDAREAYRKTAGDQKGSEIVHAYKMQDAQISSKIYLGEDIICDLKQLMLIQTNGNGFTSRYISTEINSQNPNHPLLAHLKA